jgi:hypothetical protein
MARRGKARRAKRVATPAVAALAGLPAGVDLLAAVAGLNLSSLPGFDLPLVLRAVYRLGNHTRAKTGFCTTQAIPHPRRRHHPLLTTQP